MQRGSNSIGVRRYNERLVLSTIRRLDGASKADISKLTGLSPQAAVRIVDDLENSGRLVRAGRRTGGMGQPSIIYKINGGSGCTVGAEIGRDRLTCVLLDFDGAILVRSSQPHDFPVLKDVIRDIDAFMTTELGRLPDTQRDGFLGVGIAMPWFLGEWRDELGITGAQAHEWNGSAVEDRFRSAFDVPLFFENDGNAGALSELLSGAGLGFRDFLYIHLGKFVGGGLVLGGQVHEGRNGNAGALASMPVPGGRSGTDVLLHRASLYSADVDLAERATDDMCNAWLDDCADALSFAIIGANSLLDLEAVILGSPLPQERVDALIARMEARIAADAPRDFFQPPLLRGCNGEIAPALGAGLLPLFASYSPNLGSLMKSPNTDTISETISA
ncbi:ROK family transcriptional regulator [Sphingomonas koreensis]|nr:ROK family transcriptional regulator [Sphingomonas koreensis]RSU55346.1 ROK family transcriptional regulator [Sphingomonas koreensis]RSU63764.1 ROK family transcriptional regulator [Sphingomonas koreensis]